MLEHEAITTQRLQPIAGTIPRTLKVYLLGAVDFEAALLFQKRLHYDITGDRQQAALILCEHYPLITVGRQGSHMHIRFDPEELERRNWNIRWVNRAGGCMLHLPGQLAVYPILPLKELGLSIREYLRQLSLVFEAVIGEFPTIAGVESGPGGVWAGKRMLATIGVAVRQWVTYFGGYLNVQPPLDPYRYLEIDRLTHEPMTSLARERRGPIRPGSVRQKFLEHFQTRFGFDEVALFTDHPSLDDFARRCSRSRPWIPACNSQGNTPGTF